MPSSHNDAPQCQHGFSWTCQWQPLRKCLRLHMCATRHVCAVCLLPTLFYYSVCILSAIKPYHFVDALYQPAAFSTPSTYSPGACLLLIYIHYCNKRRKNTLVISPLACHGQGPTRLQASPGARPQSRSGRPGRRTTEAGTIPARGSAKAEAAA